MSQKRHKKGTKTSQKRHKNVSKMSQKYHKNICKISQKSSVEIPLFINSFDSRPLDGAA